MKIPGFRSASGSISQKHGSPDPDPHQNVMDPYICIALSLTLLPYGNHHPFGFPLFSLPIQLLCNGSDNTDFVPFILVTLKTVLWILPIHQFTTILKENARPQPSFSTKAYGPPPPGGGGGGGGGVGGGGGGGVGGGGGRGSFVAYGFGSLYLWSQVRRSS
jgi:hypothetical protein